MATLAADIGATDPIILVNVPGAAAKGLRFRIDDELIDLSGFDKYLTQAGRRRPGVDNTRWVVNRGVGDSVKATHSAGATIVAAVSASVSSETLAPPTPFSAGGAGGVTVTGDTGSEADVTTIALSGADVTSGGAGVASVAVAGLTNPLVSPFQINVAVDDEQYLFFIKAPEDYENGFGEVIQVQNFIEDTVFGLNVFGQIVLGSSAAPKVSLNDNLIGSMAITTGSEGAAYLRATSTGVTVFTVLGSGAVVTGANVAPGDSEIAAGQVALWFDDTNGAAKLMLKGKSANGTVVVGEVALA